MEPDLDRVVEHINRIYIARGLETAVQIGRYILDEFFGGDFEAYRSKAAGATSFRRLYKRKDLAMAFSYLTSAVGVAMQVKQLPRELAWNISLSHHRTLLPLEDAGAKVELATRVVEEGVSWRDLRDEVWKLRPDDGRPGPRKVSPPMRIVRALDKGSKKLLVEVEEGGTFAMLGQDEREEVVERIDRVMARLERARASVGI